MLYGYTQITNGSKYLTKDFKWHQTYLMLQIRSRLQNKMVTSPLRLCATEVDVSRRSSGNWTSKRGVSNRRIERTEALHLNEAPGTIRKLIRENGANQWWRVDDSVVEWMSW